MSTLYTPELSNEKILLKDDLRWPKFCADFRLWEQPTKLLHTFKPNWQEVKFERPNNASVPERTGIYMFVVRAFDPLLANNQHSFILYVGQATNLRERFNGYFRYTKSTKPSDQLKRIMILLYQERLQFNFFETPPNISRQELTDIEFDLINMTVPPMNNLFRGDLLNNAIKAYAPR